MDEYEVYNKYFIDEEYDLDNSPSELHSFRSGWNEGLKRASRLLAKELRPEGEWIKKIDDVGFVSYICSSCGFRLLEDCSNSYYCSDCGAKMKGGRKDETDN